LLWYDRGQPSSGDLLHEPALAFLLAVIAALVALGALRRFRFLPSPSWIYLLCGIGATASGLHPLAGIHLAAGASIVHPDRLQGISFTPHLTAQALQSLARGQMALAATGGLLLLLSLINRYLAAGYKRRYRNL
ncbi:MAG: hypothetical protein ACR2PL_24090, partial [Dehalococcoidia bacterium]